MAPTPDVYICVERGIGAVAGLPRASAAGRAQNGSSEAALAVLDLSRWVHCAPRLGHLDMD